MEREDKILKIIGDFILSMEDKTIEVHHIDNLTIGELRDKANKIFGDIQTLRMDLYKKLGIKFYPHREKRVNHNT